jgi:hypothetical protein
MAERFARSAMPPYIIRYLFGDNVFFRHAHNLFHVRVKINKRRKNYMKKIKKSLALVLTVLMLVGLMTVSASASYSDFTDAADIKNTTAVSLLVELGIINGFEASDGTNYYAPADNITRAQMAKMVSFVLNGGVDKGTLYSGLSTGLSDISANWAKGYINQCYSLGIVAGMGDGTFNPDGNVTGAQAAKMLLVALGYNAESKGLVGSDWLLNTITLAGDTGLLDNFTADASIPLSRDNAALLIYNALEATMVTTAADGTVTEKMTTGYAKVTVDGTSAIVTTDIDMTFLNSKFNMITAEGVITSNEYTGEEAGYSTIDGIRYHFSSDLSMIGHQVELYVQLDDDKDSDELKVYGEPVDTSATVSKKQTASFSDNAYYKSMSYSSYLKTNNMNNGVDEEAVFFENYIQNTSASYDEDDEIEDAAKAIEYGQSLQMIDYDGDKDADAVLITSPVVNIIDDIDEDDETISFDLDVPGTSDDELDFDDCIGYANLVDGDYVMITDIDGLYYIEKANVVTGTVSSTSTYYAVLEGQTYYFYSGPIVSNDSTFTMWSAYKYLDSTDTSDNVKSGNTYNFVLDANGYVCYAEETSETASSYPISYVVAFSVDGTASGVGGSTETYTAYVIFDNGTTGVYDVYSIDGIKMSASTYTSGSVAEELDNLIDPNSATTDCVVTTKGNGDLSYGFFYATLNSSNKLVLRSATDKYDLTVGTITATTTSGASKIASKTYANTETNYFFVDYDDASDNGISDSGSSAYLDLDTVKHYNGYIAAPSITSSEIDYLYYVDGSTKVVVAVTYADDSISAAYEDVLFYPGSTYRSYDTNTDGTSYYLYTLYDDGASVQYKSDQDLDDIAGGSCFVVISDIDSDGFYTFEAPTADTDPTDDNGGYLEHWTVDDISNGYIDVSDGTDEFSIACDEDVPVIDISGFGVIDTMEELEDYVDNDDYIVTVSLNADDDGEVLAIYVDFVTAT